MSDLESDTRVVARHVLWHYGSGGGVRPGSFVTALLAAIAAADVINRVRLAQAFPVYVAACHVAERTEGGVAELQRMAAGETG